MNKMLNIFKSSVVLLPLAFIAGAVLVLGIRVAAYKPPANIHYHANLAVYINGQQEKFQANNYYEEEAATSCSVKTAEEAETGPMSRVHLHNNIYDVVHVEDSRVTWGNFFTVLGWNVGPGYLATRNAVYQTNDQPKVSFILNGKQVSDIANTTINDQDKLLVNYGSQSSDELSQEYKQIKNNALKADQSKDPASCGGGEKAVTMHERLQHIFN